MWGVSVCLCVCAFNYESVHGFLCWGHDGKSGSLHSNFSFTCYLNSTTEKHQWGSAWERNSRLRNNQPWPHAFGSRLWKLNIKTLLSCFFWQRERPKLRTVGSDNPINEVLGFRWSAEPAHDCEMFKWPLCPWRCQSGILVGPLASWHLASDQQECGRKSSFKKGAELCLCFFWEKTWKMWFSRNTAGLTNYTMYLWQGFLPKQLNPHRLRNAGSISYNGSRKGTLQYSDSEERVVRNLRILVKMPSHPLPQFLV